MNPSIIFSKQHSESMGFYIEIELHSRSNCHYIPDRHWSLLSCWSELHRTAYSICHSMSGYCIVILQKNKWVKDTL